MNPKSEEHIIVNICYSISTIFCIILNLLSYKEGWTMFVYAVSIILNIRQAIRLADFENTKPSLFIKDESKIKVYNWLYILVMQSLGVLSTIILQLFGFGDYKYTKFISSIQLIGFIILQRSAFKESDEPYWDGFLKYLSDYGLSLAFTIIFLIKNQDNGADTNC